MTPQENLTLKRDNFHRTVDMILDNLHGGNVEEMVSLYKEEMFRIPQIEMSVKQQNAGIDRIINSAKSDEQKMLIARNLLVAGLHFPAFHYAYALQKAAPTVGKEIGEAYLEEAKEIRDCTRFFTRMISDHLLRKRQGGE